MKAKTTAQPDLGQEIIQASADALWAIAQTGKGIFNSYFGPAQAEEAKPLAAVRRRTHAPKAATKKPRIARRNRKKK